jgi:hypothetical protein
MDCSLNYTAWLPVAKEAVQAVGLGEMSLYKEELFNDDFAQITSVVGHQQAPGAAPPIPAAAFCFRADRKTTAWLSHRIATHITSFRTMTERCNPIHHCAYRYQGLASAEDEAETRMPFHPRLRSSGSSWFSFRCCA